jgi:hypothetical protein
MKTTTTLLAGLLGAAACSDWSLRRRPDPDVPGDSDSDGGQDSEPPDSDTDTGDSDPPPPACRDLDVPEGTVGTIECGTTFGGYHFTEKWRVQFGRGYPVAVLQTDDDNLDGRIGWGDVPEVIVRGETFDMGVPGLLIVGGRDGLEIDRWAETWPYSAWGVYAHTSIGISPSTMGRIGRARDTVIVPDTRTYPSGSRTFPANSSIRCAAGIYQTVSDLDGDGLGEVLTGHRWYSPASDSLFEGSGGGFARGDYDACTAMSVELDGVAPAEFVSGNTVYSWDGSVHCRFPGGQGYTFAFDLDGDGEVDFLRVTPTEFARFDRDCNAVLYRGLEDGFLGEIGSVSSPRFEPSQVGYPFVAPVLDRIGSDLVISAIAGRTEGEEDWGWFAIGEDLVARRLTRREAVTALADLDGDGLYEMFVGPDLVDPRTGEVLGTLPMPNPGQVYGVADIDGDGEAEVLGWYCLETPLCVTMYLAAFEGDGLAPAQRWYQAEPFDRAGYQNEDGSFTKAGEYPPLSVYNTMNVADVNAEWEGFGARLAVSFADVCTDECASDRLRVALTVENTGTVGLIRPVEVVLFGEVAGVETELARVRIPTLAAGERTAGQAVWLTGPSSKAVGLRARVEAPGWMPMTCEPLPTKAWDGAVCP